MSWPGTDWELEIENELNAHRATIETLERRDVITTDPAKAETCCGIPRDEDGFCVYRPGHPIYVERREPST